MSRTKSYLRVFATFARNSLVRDMTFRGNFVIDALTSVAWAMLNLALYILIFRFTPMLGAGSGWGKYEFFLFIGTGLLINALVQAFFMTNADELSDLIRTGSLDFALLKPMDTQFLVSVRRIEWSSLANVVVSIILIVYSLARLHYCPSFIQVALFCVYVASGVAIYYSFMITLASAAVWMGRNLTLFDFWFYITNFSRYPMEIYSGPFGVPLRRAFTYFIPVLIVVNVPARMLIRSMIPQKAEDWLLPAFTLLATVLCLVFSRWIFQRSLLSYRSASS